MRSNNALLIVALVVIAAGGARYLPSVGTAPASQGAPSAGAPPSASSSALAPETPHNTDTTDALTLLADYLDVDTSVTAVQRRIKTAAQKIADGQCATPTEACTTAAQETADFCLLDLSEATNASIPSAVAAIASCKAGEAATKPMHAAQTIHRYLSNSPSNILSTVDTAPYLVALLKRAARDKTTEVEFLTVTVPDAVDSYVKWEFDNVIQAVQFAAGRLEFVLDRFYLPDWDPTTDLQNPRNLGHLHEQYPGVILFRHDRRVVNGSTSSSRILVTFLVAETPTSGVHKMALLRSLRLTRMWDPSRPLKLVGPIYSGSRESLRTAFADLRPQLDGTNKVQIISGAATRADNKQFFKDTGQVEFTSAVRPDNQLEAGLLEYLEKRIPRLKAAGRIALFRESNTGWGVSASEGRVEWNPNAQVLDIPFPLHISRLPSAADQRRQAAPVVQPFLPLPLTGAKEATDQLPVTAPETTLPSMEIVMAQLLNTIRRERVSVAGLLATDARDRLFLAQQLSTKAPDLTLFTLESDLLYAHPTYGSDLRGMLVVSTYPLFTGTQLWADLRQKDASRLQFRSTSAQGVYNAVLMHLADSAAPESALLDYRDPFDRTSSQPPVWISVVGRSGVWPLATAHVGDEAGYLAAGWSAAAGIDRQTIQLVRPTVPFAVGALTTLLWVFALPITFLSAPAGASLFKRRSPALRSLAAPLLGLATAAPRGSPFPRGDFSVTTGRRRYLIALFGTGAELAMLMTAAAWAWLGVEWSHAGWATTVLIVALGVLSGVALLLNLAATIHAFDTSQAAVWERVHKIARTVRRLVRRTPRSPETESHRDATMLSTVAYRWVVGAGAGIAFFSTLTYAASIARLGSPAATLWLTRLMQPSNGVSPAMPIILLAAAVDLWALLNLKRLGMPRRTRMCDRLEYVDELLQFDHVSVSPKTLKIRHTTPTVVSVGTVLSGIAIVLITGIPLSIEGRPFDFLYISASTLVYLLVCSLLIQTVWIWRELTGVLTTLRWHPLRKVFDRLPPGMFTARISTRAPQLEDLEPLVAASSLRVRLASPSPAPVASSTHGVQDSIQTDPFRVEDERLPGTASDIWKRFKDELADTPHLAWTDSKTWKGAGGLHEIARQAIKSLRESWRTGAPPTQEIVRQEEVVAMAIGLSLREILARLTNAILFSTVALFLLLGSHTLFPFGSKQALLATSWVFIVSAMVLSFSIFAEIDRNDVISTITRTTEGKLNWDSTMLSRIVVYGVIPIASLIAAQFPQFSDVLSQWIVPMQRMLP